MSATTAVFASESVPLLREALGAHRGGIDERGFSSARNAANGPGNPDAAKYIGRGPVHQ